MGGWECGMVERCRADQLTRICSADKKCTNTAQCHLTVSRACRQLSRRGPGPRSDYNITIEASEGGRAIFDLQLARSQYVTFATLLYWRKCNNAWKVLGALSTSTRSRTLQPLLFYLFLTTRYLNFVFWSG